HFGLGNAAVADSVVVDWPGGRRDAWAGYAVDRLATLVEGTGTVSVPEVGAPRGLALNPPSPSPCAGTSMIEVEIARAAHVRLECFDAGGRRVATAFDGALSAGRHSLRFALPAGAGPGLYWLRLSDGEAASVQRLLVLR